jgi:RNA polymerase sigma factor (sigma-70 family)
MAEQPLHTVLRHLHRLAAEPEIAEASDQDLLGRFNRSHDQAAFAELVRRHGPMVREVCRRLLGQEADVDDAFQAVFLVLARQSRSIRNRKSLSSYCYGVAYRTAQRARRDSVRRRRREARTAARAPADPAREAVWQELCRALDVELYRLPEEQRAALVLCYLEGRTRDEAARQLGQSLRTLDRRLERGRNQLRLRLARRGLTLFTALLGVGLAEESLSAGVPAVLVASTTRAATLVAAGQALAPGLLPAEAVALMEGVLKAMFRTKLKLIFVVLLALGLVGTATGFLAFRAPAQEPAASAEQVGGDPPAQAGDPQLNKDPAEPVPYALLLFEGKEGDDFAVYRRTQVVLLKSRSVLQSALRTKEVTGLAIIKKKADPIRWLERNLMATFLDNTGILRLLVVDGTQEERAVLTNAVANAYLDFVGDQQQQSKRERLQMMEKMLNENDKRLRDKRVNLREIEIALGSSQSLKNQFAREDLAGLRKELQQVHLAKIRARARLTFRNGVENGKGELAIFQEEVAVLTEQERLLKEEIAPLAKEVHASSRAEMNAGADQASMREEISAAEQTAKRLAGEIEALRVDSQAAPRVRILQKAESSRPRK